MSDDVLERWMRLEMRSVVEGLVRVPRPLADLLREPEPWAATAGEPHRFDAEALRRFAAALPAHLQARVRLPIRFHLQHEDMGDAYVADPAALEALVALRPHGPRPREGRLWMGAPLARTLAAEYPTLFQFVFA